MKPKRYQRAGLYRFLTKGIILAFFVQLLITAFLNPNMETTSAESYCLFGGLESVYKFVVEGDTLSHVHDSNLILLGLVLLITLFLGAGFCGWICPLGSVQDILRRIGKWAGGLSILKPAAHRFHKWVQKRRPILSAVDRYARYLRFAVLLWAVGGAAYFGELVFRDYDPFMALFKTGEAAAVSAYVVLAAVLVASLFIERPWCKYACPLGAFLGLVSKLSTLKVTRNESLCKSCNICTKSCPMNIDVANVSKVSQTSCNQCLTCVDSCPSPGALDLSWGRTGSSAVKGGIPLEK